MGLKEVIKCQDERVPQHCAENVSMSQGWEAVMLADIVYLQAR